MRKLATYLATACLTLVAADLAAADVAMRGKVNVTQACAAYDSIRRGSNPGAVTVEPGKSYDVIAANKPEPTHYRVIIPGASPPQRWIGAACGSVTAAPAPAASLDAPPAAKAGGKVSHVLALSWQPTFCGSPPGKSKAECVALKPSSAASRQLSLHGLWPENRAYCSVPGASKKADADHKWEALPEPELTPGTRSRLESVMPGTKSLLQRHEWAKHGTCFGASADAYFSRAAGLVEAVNASKVAKLFADNIGRPISSDDIRAAFDEAFGAGTGARVRVTCSGQGAGRRISEVRLNLAGDVTGGAPLGDLMRAAGTAKPACPSGIVSQPPP